jgi:hypothetical protein
MPESAGDICCVKCDFFPSPRRFFAADNRPGLVGGRKVGTEVQVADDLQMAQAFFKCQVNYA